jgi:hypothetical protein
LRAFRALVRVRADPGFARHSIFDGDGAQSIFHNAAAIAGLAGSGAGADPDAKVRESVDEKASR